MNQRSAILVALLGVFLGAVGLCAQEQSTAAESIELERTLGGVAEIELLKKGIAGGGEMQPGGAQDFVPTVTTDNTGLQSAMLSPASEGDSSEQLEAERWAEENWLLAGMRNLENGGEAANGPKMAGALADENTAKSQSELWLQAAMDGEAAAAARSEEALLEDEELRADALSTTNPLDQFMAGWLSPDRSTDGVTFASGAISMDSSPDEGSVISPLAVESNTAWQGLLDLREPIATKSFSRAATDQINPYTELVQAWTLRGDDSLVEQPQLGPNSMGATSSPPAASSLELGPVLTPVDKPATRWVPPERKEEKYFPRLNRF